MFCPNCGNKLSAGIKFCSKCGQEIDSAWDTEGNYSTEDKVQTINKIMQDTDKGTSRIRNTREVHFSDELYKGNLVLKTSEPFSNEIQNVSWVGAASMLIVFCLTIKTSIAGAALLSLLAGLAAWLIVRTVTVLVYYTKYRKISFYLPYQMTVQELEIVARRVLNPIEVLIDTNQELGRMKITYKGLIFDFLLYGDVFEVHWRIKGAKALLNNVYFVYMNRAISSISYLVYQIQQEIFRNDSVSQVYYTTVPGEYKKAKAKLPTILFRGLMILFGVITLIALALAEIKNLAGNENSNGSSVFQSENEYVASVKNGSPLAYPDKTYGEAFENFFGSPKWKYFLGTKEGLDEDSDGVPDSTEENVDVVEFTGYCTYQNVEVKALLQFTLSQENDTFEATYLSFNEVPQNYLMLATLLDAVFTNGELETPTNNDTANMNEDTNEDKTIDYFTCYQPIISGIPISAVQFKYCLYDLDKDGIMELIVETEEVAGGFLADIYTIENNQPVFLSNEYVCYASFYETEDGNGLYISYGHMGNEYVYRMTKQGHSISVEEAWTIETGRLNDYYENDHPILKCDVPDCSILRNPPPANTNPVMVDESYSYIFCTSSCQYLTESDLMGLDAFTCKIARNEIYARYSRLFTDQELQAYFNGKNWYYGLVEPDAFDDSILNEFERANLDLIIQYETNKGYR